MTGRAFRFLEKPPAPEILDAIFDLLATSMRVIAPTGLTYEEDKATWMASVPPALEQENRQMVLIYAGDELAGYFQYSITTDHSVFSMEGIVIKEPYRGSGVFGDLYRFLIPRLPDDIRFVEASADKRNAKSLAVLGHLGLTIIGENKNGISYRLRGDFAKLKEKYG